MDTQETKQNQQAQMSAPHVGGEEQRKAAAGQREQKRPRGAVHCANCDIEFSWSPTIEQGRSYCCIGCAAGGPCTCDYSLYRSVTIAGVVHYDP